MLSPSFFNYISLALSIKLDNPLPFAGLSCLLVCDLSQMEPVASHNLWTPTERLSSFAKQGQELYRQKFTKIFVLKTVMRQAKDLVFQKLLFNIRRKKVTEMDMLLLKSRCNLSKEDRERFSSSIHILPLNSQIRKVNIMKCSSLGYPLVHLKPHQTPPTPIMTEEELCFPICLNASILVQRNYHLGLGISTNTVGKIKGILFNPENLTNLPAVLMVEFEGIDLPQLQGLVPIVPIVETIKHPDYDISFSVSFFPIKLAYAISIHKSQGIPI